ncbi:hypothetical protein DACRYDRAFT_63041, partial [Dacryopinax primogenitus]
MQFTSFVALVLAASASALNITVLQHGVPLAPSPLPLPGAAKDCDEIVNAFSHLGRTTVWNLVQKIKMQGDTYEPEGLVRIGDDRFFVSAGEYTAPTTSYGNGTIINGTDRQPGAGFAHIIIFDGNGTRIADATLTQEGAIEYHNGGIDYDGKYIWATIAQYRANATATLVRIDPLTIDMTTILHIADHQGGVVHDVDTGNLHMLNWGSRNASTWNLNYVAAPYPEFTRPRAITRNPSYYADYQDCKFLGHPAQFDYRGVMLCSGVTGIYGTQIGGIAIVDLKTMVPLMEVPITMISDLGVLVTENPVDVAMVDGKLRVYFMPDQHNSTLYVYEPTAAS